MTIPVRDKQIYDLSRQLRDAQAQLTLAAARVSDIAARLAAAKAARPTLPPLTDEQAAVEAVERWLAGGWVE
jgi:hypothetical protein